MDSQWVTWVSQIGFPIVIALWFMFRLEKRMDKVLEVLTKEAELLKVIYDCTLDGRKDQ